MSFCKRLTERGSGAIALTQNMQRARKKQEAVERRDHPHFERTRHEDDKDAGTSIITLVLCQIRLWILSNFFTLYRSAINVLLVSSTISFVLPCRLSLP